MTDRIFFDTNTVVYLFDSSEKEKHFRVNELLSEYIGKFSVCILWRMTVPLFIPKRCSTIRR